MILSTPPPAPPTAVETAEWLTDTVERMILDEGAADRYAITEFACVDYEIDTEIVPGDFVCTSPWIHHGRTEYLSGRFTWTGDGYECHGWTVTDDPPPWYETPTEQAHDVEMIR